MRMHKMFTSVYPRRGDKKTPGHDSGWQVDIVIRSWKAASAVTVVVIRIIKLIEMAATIMGG